MISVVRFGLSLAVLWLAMAHTLRALAEQTIFQLRPLSEFLRQNNWVPLSIPDSKMRPGSVIRVTSNDNRIDVQWLGDFRKCGITDEDFGFTRGKYPSIGIGEDFSVQASLGARLLASVGASAEVEKVNGAILKIEEAGGDAIDLLAFSLWLSKPGNMQKLPVACTEFLARDNTFLITEAFRVSKGSYELVDKNGAKLAVSAAIAGRSVGGEAKVSVGSTGELVVTDDFYFGVRRVKQLAPGTFETLGAHPDIVPEADDLLRRLNQE